MSQPSLMRHREMVLGAALILAGLAALWVRHAWPLVLALPVSAWRIVYLSWLVRCPQCSRRMRYRECSAPGDPHGNPKMYYDCHDCRVTWDPHTFDEMAE